MASVVSKRTKTQGGIISIPPRHAGTQTLAQGIPGWFGHLPRHKDADKIKELVDRDIFVVYLPKKNQTPKGPRRYAHMAKKTSSPEWLGDFQCLSADEAIIWGPVFKADLISYGNDITHALYNHVKDVNVRLHLRRGKCVLVELQLVHAFWNRTLVFRFPPMKASEVVACAWGAIITAMTRPNVDPVALARESLSHGFPPHENPDSESFSIIGQE